MTCRRIQAVTDTRESESAVLLPLPFPGWGSPWGLGDCVSGERPTPWPFPARGGERNQRASSDPRRAIGFSLGGARKRRRSAMSWLATSRELREDGRMARLLE